MVNNAEKGSSFSKTSRIRNGITKAGTGIDCTPSLRVPVRSSNWISRVKPRLAALLIVVMLLSITYEIPSPPRTEVLPSLNGSHAKLQLGAKLFQSLLYRGRPPPDAAPTSAFVVRTSSPVPIGRASKPFSSFGTETNSQRKPKFNVRLSRKRQVSPTYGPTFQ